MAVTPAAVLQTIHSHMIRKPANLTLVCSITNHQLNDILGQSSYAIYYYTGTLFSLSSKYLNIFHTLSALLGISLRPRLLNFIVAIFSDRSRLHAGS